MTDKKLTKVERLILLNQYKILSKLDSDADFYESNIEILESGYEYDYDSLFGAIDEDPVPVETCRETIEILNMFRRFDHLLYNITDEQKTEMGDDIKKLKFQGFDANNDKHYFYTKFMINKQGKWDELHDKYLNSHNSYTIELYRKMLAEYKSSKISGIQEVTYDDIKIFLSKI